MTIETRQVEPEEISTEDGGGGVEVRAAVVGTFVDGGGGGEV